MFGDSSSLMRRGTAPASTTARVWSVVPPVMLIRAQVASNWTVALEQNGYFIVVRRIKKKELCRFQTIHENGQNAATNQAFKMWIPNVAQFSSLGESNDLNFGVRTQKLIDNLL
jgi:hypothetical protein